MRARLPSRCVKAERAHVAVAAMQTSGEPLSLYRVAKKLGVDPGLFVRQARLKAIVLEAMAN